MAAAMRGVKYAIAVSALSLIHGTARAATTDTEIGAGIGTVVADVYGDGSSVPIRTSVTSVTYEDPVLRHRNGLRYFEVLGLVQGTGWGGQFEDLSEPESGIVDAESHYSYSVPFVLRFRAGWDGTLVDYAHGRATLGFNAFLDSMLGEENEGRRVDELEGQFVSDAVLQPWRRHAFFAANLGGLDRDGAFSVIAVDGPFAGQPLNASTDVPVSRDLALVAERLLKRLTGRGVERTFGVGHSGGALIMQFVNSGISVVLDGPRGGAPLFNGGNFQTAYDSSSGTIFEGMIPLAGGLQTPVHPDFPLTAPIMLVGGNADYSGVDMVRYASQLQRAGVDLNGSVRIYQVGNLPHGFAEILESAPNQAQVIEDLFGVASNLDAERVAPLVAAAIDNLKDWVVKGAAPPLSYVNGEAIDENVDGIPDRIRFQQTAGATTSLVPFAEDASIDQFVGEQFELSAAGGFPGTVRRYAEVLGALDHVPSSLSLPYVRCRVGGYELGFDAKLLPFEDLDQRWRSFGRYAWCAERAMLDLSRKRLYDFVIGNRSIFSERIISLF